MLCVYLYVCKYFPAFVTYPMECYCSKTGYVMVMSLLFFKKNSVNRTRAVIEVMFVGFAFPLFLGEPI